MTPDAERLRGLAEWCRRKANTLVILPSTDLAKDVDDIANFRAIAMVLRKAIDIQVATPKWKHGFRTRQSFNDGVEAFRAALTAAAEDDDGRS